MREREGTAVSLSFRAPLAFLKLWLWRFPSRSLAGWGAGSVPGRGSGDRGSARRGLKIIRGLLVAPGEITAPIASGTLSLLPTIVCGQ